MALSLPGVLLFSVTPSLSPLDGRLVELQVNNYHDRLAQLFYVRIVESVCQPFYAAEHAESLRSVNTRAFKDAFDKAQSCFAYEQESKKMFPVEHPVHSHSISRLLLPAGAIR